MALEFILLTLYLTQLILTLFQRPQIQEQLCQWLLQQRPPPSQQAPSSRLTPPSHNSTSETSTRPRVPQPGCQTGPRPSTTGPPPIPFSQKGLTPPSSTPQFSTSPSENTTQNNSQNECPSKPKTCKKKTFISPPFKNQRSKANEPKVPTELPNLWSVEFGEFVLSEEARQAQADQTPPLPPQTTQTESQPTQPTSTESGVLDLLTEPTPSVRQACHPKFKEYQRAKLLQTERYLDQLSHLSLQAQDKVLRYWILNKEWVDRSACCPACNLGVNQDGFQARLHHGPFKRLLFSQLCQVHSKQIEHFLTLESLSTTLVPGLEQNDKAALRQLTRLWSPPQVLWPVHIKPRPMPLGKGKKHIRRMTVPE